MIYYVYLLRTSADTLYCGISNDLGKRLNTHRQGKGAKYLRMFDSFELVYTEEFATKSEALSREYAIKQLTRKQKEYLIKSV